MYRFARALLIGVILSAPPALAQSAGVTLDFSAEVVSRYVVRGLDFGASPSVQPVVAASGYGFDVGTWGNYGLTGTDEGNGAELDFWIGYTQDLGSAGALRVGLVDYFFDGQRFFEFGGDGTGAHYLEAQLRYERPAGLPVYVFAGRNIHNDADGSWYAEAGYSGTVGDVGLEAAAGVAGGESAWYRVEGSAPALINLQLKLSKRVPVTDAFALPVSATFTVNPHAERVFLVVGLSL
jgi:hypothetical protein